MIFLNFEILLIFLYTLNGIRYEPVIVDCNFCVMYVGSCNLNVYDMLASMIYCQNSVRLMMKSI
jgi:hypothetical protein